MMPRSRARLPTAATAAPFSPDVETMITVLVSVMTSSKDTSEAPISDSTPPGSATEKKRAWPQSSKAAERMMRSASWSKATTRVFRAADSG